MSLLALSLLAWLSAEPGAPPSRPLTVSVDLGGVERGTAADRFVNEAYKGLLVRLVGEGLAFIEATSPADIRVRVLKRSGGTIDITVETRVSAAKTRLPPTASGEAEQLRFMHATLDLVRAARAALLARPVRPGAAPRPAPALWPASAPPAAGPTSLPARSQPPPPSGAFGARADAGVMVSARSVGVLTDVGVVARRGRWGLSLGAVLHQPLGVMSDLSLLEWGSLAGTSYRVGAMGSRWAVEPGVAVGLWQHRYQFADATGAHDRGWFLDPTLAAHVRLTARVTPAWHAGVVLGALVTLHERVHETPQRILWRGPQLRPTATLVVEWLR